MNQESLSVLKHPLSSFQGVSIVSIIQGSVTALQSSDLQLFSETMSAATLKSILRSIMMVRIKRSSEKLSGNHEVFKYKGEHWS